MTDGDDKKAKRDPMNNEDLHSEVNGEKWDENRELPDLEAKKRQWFTFFLRSCLFGSVEAAGGGG